MGKVTIVDVAKAANVSNSSVSRYLANPQSINPILAVRIAAAIDKLHYIPNLSARSLRRGSTRVIGFIQPDITQDLFNQAMKALNEMFSQNNYLLITCDSDNNPEKELKYVNSLIEQNVEGIIISPCLYKSEATIHALSNCDNFVFLDRFLETDKTFSCVLEDNYEKSVLLTNALFSFPQKKHLILAGAKSSYVTRERLRGVRDAFANSNIELKESDILYDLTNSEESIRIITEQLKKGYNAILFTNPKIINSIYIASRKLGYKINRDIFIAGYAYHSTVSQYEFQFPCVIQHPYELGLAAGDLILRKIQKQGSKPKQIVIPCEFRP